MAVNPCVLALHSGEMGFRQHVLQLKGSFCPAIVIDELMKETYDSAMKDIGEYALPLGRSW